MCHVLHHKISQQLVPPKRPGVGFVVGSVEIGSRVKLDRTGVSGRTARALLVAELPECQRPVVGPLAGGC